MLQWQWFRFALSSRLPSPIGSFWFCRRVYDSNSVIRKKSFRKPSLFLKWIQLPWRKLSIDHRCFRLLFCANERNAVGSRLKSCKVSCFAVKIQKRNNNGLKLIINNNSSIIRYILEFLFTNSVIINESCLQKFRIFHVISVYS